MLIQMSSDHDSEDERHSKLNEVPGENLTTEEMRSPHAPDRHLDKDAWATNQEYDNEHHDEGVESAEIKSEGHEYYDENGAIETSLLSRGVFDEFRLWEKPPKLANRLDKHSIFSASTNSANGLDVVLPGGAMIRSSQDGENELRYSYVEPDGDTYDISDIVDDDVLEGVLGPDKALLGEKMDRLLYKIQSRRHQPTFSPLREEEQASDNDLDDGPESEYEPGTSYNRRSPLTKSRNALNGRVVLKTPGSPWCPVAVNQPIRFRSSVSNKSMDYDYHNGMGPLNLQQYRTNHHANQKFEIQSVGPKGFCIRHVASGRYLTTGNTGDRRVNMEVGNFPTLFTFEKLLDDDGGWNGAVQ
ncbi:hypothetical protein B0H19DRAFT_488001 [Mycena capillaripes]|nr:hypothetical protein B0H19DRAFT_488001 [Mycena capillaripes]